MSISSARSSAGSSGRKRTSRSRPSGAPRHSATDAEGTARSTSRAGNARATGIPEARTGHKRGVVSTMKELPNFLRLVGGLLADSRVAATDKLLVAGAVGYVLLPMDFVPDFIPFIGEIDDVFLLVLALQRLIANAPRAVVLQHWMGDPRQLRSLDLERVLVAAAFFLPRRMRRRLRAIGRDI
ncbi:MAG: YkvA family protein [Gemmatimonadaceae bacterium]